MYVKWIICEVNPNLKHSFSKAQTKWHELENSPGFITQFGGWNSENTNQACIISLWENKHALTFFMSNVHDLIFDKIKQKQTYHTCDIQHFTNNFTINNNNFKIIKNISTRNQMQVMKFSDTDNLILENKLKNRLSKLNKNESYFTTENEISEILYVSILNNTLRISSLLKKTFLKSKTIILNHSWTILSKTIS